MAKKTAKNMANKPEKKLASGGARLKAKGLTAVMFGLTKEQLDKIDRASEAVGMTARTQFFMYHGLAAADQILEKLAKKDSTAS